MQAEELEQEQAKRVGWQRDREQLEAQVTSLQKAVAAAEKLAGEQLEACER